MYYNKHTTPTYVVSFAVPCNFDLQDLVITTTQLYMHLVNLDSDEWTCRTAATKEEAMSLIEGGFQYVTTIEGIQLFKKSK